MTTIYKKDSQITLVKRAIEFAASRKNNSIPDSIHGMVKTACLFESLRKHLPDIQHHAQVVSPNVDTVKRGYCEVYYLKINNMIFGMNGEDNLSDIDTSYRQSGTLFILYPNDKFPETESMINEQGLQFVVDNFPNRKDDILNEYLVIDKEVAEIVQDILMEINTAPAINKRQQPRL